MQIAVRRAVQRVGRERARAVAQRQRRTAAAFPLHVRHEQAARLHARQLHAQRRAARIAERAAAARERRAESRASSSRSA